MGYRNKIAILTIEKHEAIKDKTYAQLKKEFGDGDYVGCYELADEVYEVGKYWQHDFLKKFKKDIFTKKSTNRHFNSEGEFYIIGKDGLKAIIDSYHAKILAYYKSLLTPGPEEDKWGKTTPEEHIKAQIQEWESKYVPPYNLDPKRAEIVSSWKFEYTIFELVRIYKSIDESKHLVCLTGW